MKNPFKGIFKDDNRNWFYTFGSIFLVLVLVYISLHSWLPGEEIVKFSKEEIANIEAIVDNVSDTTNKSKKDLIESEREIIREYVKEYILSMHVLSDISSKANLEMFLTQYANAGFPTSFLNEYKLKVHSYFWLTEDKVFLEIVFWSLFGVLCSLFYYISEAMAKGEFKPEQEYIHAAKLFYAPITTLVIYFSINALISNGEVNLNSLRNGLIILSFVLGFFSGRTIELLTRIKDLVLPAANQEKQIESSGIDKVFEQLGELEQHEIVLRAIEVNDEKWRSKLPYIQSIGSGKKYVDGKKTSTNAIVFTVNKKVDTLNQLDRIPEVVAYDGYHIPTDVQEVPGLIVTQAARALGSGISRIDLNQFGTIGLKVYRGSANDRSCFILSCFHVLCYSELIKDQLEVLNSTNIINPEVVCPCRKDDSSVSDNIIAKIEKGKLNSYLDAAIARLPFESIIENKIGSIINPSTIYDLKKADEDNGFSVQTWGWVSKHQVGMVKKISDNPKITYASPVKEKILKELIQVEKISEEGDSGAPVFTMAGEVVGIIVGGDNQTVSYVLPIRTIINGLGISLD